VNYELMWCHEHGRQIDLMTTAAAWWNGECGCETDEEEQ